MPLLQIELQERIASYATDSVRSCLAVRGTNASGRQSATGPIAQAITKTFGNFKDFQAKFNDAGVKQFGSGWVWLTGKPGGDVQVISTPNQDSPISQGLYPIFGNDVWEHAYYLKYNNRRPEYLAAWWNVVNWDEINSRYEAFKSGKAVHEPAIAHR
jgi:superoxide dismutase, Fe-Mn family